VAAAARASLTSGSATDGPTRSSQATGKLDSPPISRRHRSDDSGRIRATQNRDGVDGDGAMNRRRAGRGTLPRSAARDDLALHDDRKIADLRVRADRGAVKHDRSRTDRASGADRDGAELHDAVFKQMRLGAALVVQSRIVTDRDEIEFGEVGRVEERAPPDARSENSKEHGEKRRARKGARRSGTARYS
jgi:hypothetical protein